MKNNITELVFIIDRSGSMAGMEKDAIGGFNSMIEKQKKLDGKVYVSTVLFNNSSFVLHDRISIESIGKMTEEDYCVGGGTALMDAIGEAILHIGNIHKYIREEDVPERTLFVITTDGYENASHLYNTREVKDMIKKYEIEKGWEFLFIAANIDVAEVAGSIGISPERSANYDYSPSGTSKMYEAMSDTIINFRETSEIRENWSEKFKKIKDKK